MLLLLRGPAFAAPQTESSATVPAPPPVATFPAPAIAPPLPTPRIDDQGLPPVPADDPYNENDPNRTPANMLGPDQIKAILENETSRYWLAAHRTVYGANGGALQTVEQAEARPRKDAPRPVLVRAHSNWSGGKKLLALTFDDGPHTATTQPILDVLKQYRVPATFFFVGEMAERHPDLVRAAFKDGHSIGNHTYHHVTLVKLSEGDALTEVEACSNVLRAITGEKPHLFRPPGGQYTPVIERDTGALGYTTVLWTGDPGDYNRLHPAVIAQRTLQCARPGGIIILHSGVWQTVRALPYLIKSLRGEGYTLVSVDQMLQMRARFEASTASASVRTASVPRRTVPATRRPGPRISSTVR